MSWVGRVHECGETHRWILCLQPRLHPIESFSSIGRTCANDVLRAVRVGDLAVLTRNTSVCPCSNTRMGREDVAVEDEQKYTLRDQVAHDEIQKNALSSLFSSQPSIRNPRTLRLHNVRHRQSFHSSSSIVHKQDNDAFLSLKLELANSADHSQLFHYLTDGEKRSIRR